MSIITTDFKKIHVELDTQTEDNSGNVIIKYYLVNNSADKYIDCYFDLVLVTELSNKTVNINIDQLDDDVVKLSESYQISTTNPTIKKTLNLSTQLLLFTLTTTKFIGHLYGNIKKRLLPDISSSTTTTTTNTTNITNDTGGGQVNYATSYDAFGRFRTSQPLTLFDNAHAFSKGIKFTEYVNASGSATFNATDSSVDLTVVNQANSMIIRESKTVFSYQPGKSLLSLNTFAFNNTSGNNLIQRVGYFTGHGQSQYDLANNFAPRNGIYFEASGNLIYMNKANGGSVTKIAQSSWNGYKFDGSAPYYITLDVTKAQIYWIDIEWLGVGSVRTGFIINGSYIIAHVFHHANILSTTYMQTACLPVRYELINTTTGTGGTMKQICSTVISEGGYDVFTPILHAGLNNYLKTVDTSISRSDTPLVSIRLKSNRLNSIVLPSQLSIISTSADNIIYKILLNADISGTTNWQSAGSDSSVEYDISGTSITGGSQLNAGYIKSQTTLNLASKNDFNLQLGKYFSSNAYSYTSDVITITTSLVNNNGSNYSISGVVGWYDVLK
jgi:hypothetical protein